jgi:hypothetical protein
MKTIIHATLAAAYACALAPAHAGATFQTWFAHDIKPFLRTGLSGYDTPDMLDGMWALNKNYDARVDTREQVGTTVDPVTGVSSPVWGNHMHSSDRNGTDYAPLSFGSVVGFITPLPSGNQTSANAATHNLTLGVSGTVRDVPAEITGSATWDQNFWLAAGTTITFSGLATMAATGDVPSMDPVASILGGDGQSFASLVYADSLNRAQVRIGATLSNLADGLTGVFNLSTDPGGRMSLSITNTGTERLYGNLSAGAYLNTSGNIAGPVPEPATWLMLLGGAALVGGVARRRTPGKVVMAV